jgi:4-amino-4-deoxy-L-arabinose transferase-like glycosyltransferase
LFDLCGDFPASASHLLESEITRGGVLDLNGRIAIGIFGLGLLLRGTFVLWAPEAGMDDGFFYTLYALRILAGEGYSNPDGSPAIQWPPGWPGLLSLLFATFGIIPKLPFYANAVFGAATSVLVASLGCRLFGRQIGATAGILYALWPGIVYYSATCFTEPFFAFLLVATLYLLVSGVHAVRGRWLLLTAAGICFGISALIKAEPLALSPVLLVFLWLSRRSRADFLRSSALVFISAAIIIAPWTVRNTLTFGQLIPVSANGGANFHLGSHHNANGGEDIFFSRHQVKRHSRPTRSQTTLAVDKAGWREGWRFVREHPSEEFQIILRKLRKTYLSDHQGAHIVRGFGAPSDKRLTARTVERLVRVADAYWFAVALLAAIGLFVVRWCRESAILLGGVVATWFCIHLVFLGGDRFRLPEAPVYALLAAGGILWLRDRRWYRG